MNKSSQPFMGDSKPELATAVGATVANATTASATLNLSGNFASRVTSEKISTVTLR